MNLTRKWVRAGLVFVFFLVSVQNISAVSVPCVNNCPDLSPGTTAGEWPMVGANLQRTSWNTEAVRGMLSVEWYSPITNSRLVHYAQPIVAGGKVYIATAKSLFAFNATTGIVAWTYGTTIPFGANPTYANGTVYVGGLDRRVHAVNASNGLLKTGWTFAEAGAGFETNPLVTNNRVYIGNRDGYMYCLDANDGHLIWKWRDDTDEWADAPIRDAVAYKNGVIYWGQDNAHAYALKDNGGTTPPTLQWKSFQMPGVGFTSYWTVLYHDKGTNKDYVLMSGSKKSTFRSWFAEDFYYTENYDQFAGTAYGTLIGNLGNVSGDWAGGTVTIDASKIQNYYNAKPYKRHLVVLDVTTGSEYPTFPPVNFVSVNKGGNKRPPIIGMYDGVIYTHNGYKNGNPPSSQFPEGERPNNGASGSVSGWKFGTQYISRLYDFVRGFADEPVYFSGGGELVYWAEAYNMGYGSFGVDKPMGSNSPVEYSACASRWGCLGIPNGGEPSYLVPYNNRLYMLDGNQLISFKAGVSGPIANPVANPVTSNLALPSSIPPEILRQKLELEIAKIISAGPLRPGFHDSGFWSFYANGAYPPFDTSPYTTGDHIAEYFHTPTDTIETLYWALPYVSPTIQNEIKTYIKNNYGPGKPYDVTTIAHVGWKNGAQREVYLDTPELTEVMKRTYEDMNLIIAAAPRTVSQYPGELNKVWNFPQDAFYGAWKYAQLYPSEALAVFNAIKGKLETPNLSNPDLLHLPYILNQWINGYIGYTELGKMANANITAQQTILNNLVDLRMNNFSIAFNDGSYERTLTQAKNFMFMTPELAALMKNRIPTQVQNALNQYTDDRPYWLISKFDELGGEGIFDPLYINNALFQAKARIAGHPYTELTTYLDAPAFWRGDLFYIQDLVAAIEASGTLSVTPSPTPVAKPGDLNGDGVIDYRDLTFFIFRFGQNGMNIFSLNTLVKNYAH